MQVTWTVTAYEEGMSDVDRVYEIRHELKKLKEMRPWRDLEDDPAPPMDEVDEENDENRHYSTPKLGWVSPSITSKIFPLTFQRKCLFCQHCCCTYLTC